MALLTEGEPGAALSSINIALLTEGQAQPLLGLRIVTPTEFTRVFRQSLKPDGVCNVTSPAHVARPEQAS